ncbi:MAG: LysM peptidoglycan-binding domain-containing protein [Pseudomonadota bacterium]
MDLFGFAKDVGRRLFRTEDDAVDKIKELIEQNNPGVKDLGVNFENGVVSLTGECSSPAAMQKCALLAGNVQGVSDVYVNKMTLSPAAAAAAEAAIAAKQQAEAAAAEAAAEAEEAAANDDDEVELYVVQSGDTLGKIAKEFLGKSSAYMKIFEANAGIIDDPNKIYVGQTIRIPKA